MRNYIILNGVNSNTITGLLISTLPPITKPKIRTQVEEIDGRDGDIVTKLGYSAYEKEFQIGLYGDFDIDEVIAYFNSEGTVVFSNEDDKYYNYQIVDQIDFEKLIRFKTASIKMHVQPFKYPTEETPVEITIQNITASGETMSLNNIADAPIEIDLKGNTSQDGTPTPEAPVEIETTTGGQEVDIFSSQLLDISNGSMNNINFNVDNEGYLIIKGTATGDHIDIPLNTPLKMNGTYTYVGKSIQGSVNNIAIKNSAYSNVFLGNNTSITSNVNNIATQIVLYLSNGTTYDNKLKVMITKGNQEQDIQPYKNQRYEINLGKNLFYLPEASSSHDITYSINNDGTVNLKGTATNNAYFTAYKDISASELINGGTYTWSSNKALPSGVEVRLEGYNGTTWVRHILAGNVLSSTNQKITGTVNLSGATRVRYTFYVNSGSQIDISDLGIQLERGSTQTTFSKQKEPIELCKIGDYQDRIYKEAGKWYIERQIGKVVLNGSNSESWQQNSGATLTNTNYFSSIAIDGLYKQNGNGLSNYFTRYSSLWSNDIEGIQFSNDSSRIIRLRINKTTANNETTLKTWLSTHNTTIYYVLAEPTTTEITDSELITQLEAINIARSYDPVTNISQNTANKPFILDAIAVQKGSDTGVVNNTGNIYSKPTLDIEGTGIAEIYLDGNQMFNVDLSTINECIIDTTNLEAYDPATSQLMNRQVTGDYSNFKLNTGNNTIKVSGNVSKVTISDYTRWL